MTTSAKRLKCARGRGCLRKNSRRRSSGGSGVSTASQERIMMSIILNRPSALSACGRLAGIRMISPAATTWRSPEIVISACPSTTWTRASNGAVCSLRPWAFVEGEESDGSGRLTEDLPADDRTRLVFNDLSQRSGGRAGRRGSLFFDRTHRLSSPLTVRRLTREESMVGTGGFEPPTPCTPSMCATRLRHVPP